MSRYFSIVRYYRAVGLYWYISYEATSETSEKSKSASAILLVVWVTYIYVGETIKKTPGARGGV